MLHMQHTSILRKFLTKDNFSFFILILLIVSTVFSIRKVLLSESSFALGEYSDFTTLSLYFSDLLTILYIFLNFKLLKNPNKLTTLLILWILVSSLVAWPTTYYKLLLLYSASKFVMFLVLHETIKIQTFSSKKLKTLLTSGLLAILVSAFISLAQFGLQHSLGSIISHLGEPKFNSFTWNVAKISEPNYLLTRVYGTFPHPNVNSYFLATFILISCFLLYTSKKPLNKVFFGISIGFLIIILVLTFSRGTIIALFSSLLIMLIYTLFKRKNRKYIIGALILLLFLLILQFNVSRGRNFISDSSIQERIMQYKTSIYIISHHVVSGTGPGMYMLHAKHDLPSKTAPWDIQPVHNIYLLIASELGLVGFGLFFLLFLFYLRGFYKYIKKNDPESSQTAILGFIFLTFSLICGFFDHYLFTLQQPILFFWLILALFLANSKNYKATPYDTYDHLK